jgi:ComF family protein
VNKWIKSIQSGLLTSLLPPVCVLCGAEGQAHNADLCLPCQSSLPWASAPCARCALPLSATSAAPVEALCGHCQTQPPAFAACLAVFQYQPPLDYLLQQLKFNGRLVQARLLGALMAQWLAGRLDDLPDHIIAVPLHAARLRERGFNQALELAYPISRRLGVPLRLNAVRRLLATPPQSALSRKQRLNNMRGAFEIRQPLHGYVVIVDDVMTTGSTADELAKTLLVAGAERVDVWVCARA